MTPVEHAEQMLRSAEQDYEASKPLARARSRVELEA
jgi:hypothetical protein